MKFSTAAGPIASALSLAAVLVVDKAVKRIPVLGAVKLTATDGAITVKLNNLDAQVMLEVPANITEPGEIAVGADKLAALTAGFAKDASVTITTEVAMAVIRSGRSRFKLPVFPIDDLPVLAFGDETGRTVISRDDAIRLFASVAFAISKEQTRYYLNGVFLHDTAAALTAVATDGHRLARVTIAGAAGLSADRGCIVPLAAAKIVTKLLNVHRDHVEVILRRSSTLIEIAGGSFRLTSKLIDGTFPDYQRAISGGDGGTNIVTVDRLELLAAIERIGAVAGDGAIAGLVWGPGRDGLHLYAAGQGDAALDVVAAQDSCGAGRTAFKASHGRDWLEIFDGDTVTIDAADPGAPVWITAPSAADFLVVQMPCRWSDAPAQTAEAAA